MLDKIAKGAKTLPGVSLVAGALLVGGAAYALSDDGDQGTVTIEQVASEPTVSETTQPAPVVTTSEPAATSEPVVSETSAPEETTVPKTASTEPNRVVTVGPDPEVKPLPSPAGLGNGSGDNGDGNGNFTVAPPAPAP